MARLSAKLGPCKVIKRDFIYCPALFGGDNGVHYTAEYLEKARELCRGYAKRFVMEICLGIPEAIRAFAKECPWLPLFNVAIVHAETPPVWSTGHGTPARWDNTKEQVWDGHCKPTYLWDIRKYLKRLARDIERYEEKHGTRPPKAQAETTEPTEGAK